MTAGNICSVQGCDSSHRMRRGMCNRHYRRWKAHGDPTAGGIDRYRGDPDATIRARTARDGDCLVWTGTTNPEGYAVVWSSGKQLRVHRYIWEKANGPIPQGLQIDHRCRNTSCCDLEHLRLVTQKQNRENLGLYANNKSGYRGVCWAKSMNKWRAMVTHHGEKHIAGYFADVHEAGRAARDLRNALFTHNDLDRTPDGSH